MSDQQSQGRENGAPEPRTLTGILEWPTTRKGGENAPSVDGRIRQVSDAAVLLDSPEDPYVPVDLANRFPLRSGAEVKVRVVERKPRRRRGRRPSGPAKPRAVVEDFLEIEGLEPSKYASMCAFEDLTSIDPEPRLTLEHPGCPDSARLVDLFCPIGRGQRALIVSPPKAGKTTLLKDLTKSILHNHDDVHLVLLLIDERPEEVTDFKRSFARTRPDDPWPHPWAEDRIQILASSNDHDTDRHIQVATLTMDRCKRMVEAGRHVVVMLDSITRLGRAFNRSRRHASSGRTLSGGIDSKALEVPRQIFGAARNTEEAGSLTMIGTCLVETGSQGDQVIFEEFKGSGNMELILDRKIAEQRLFPAINLAASGTRKEEKLLGEQAYKTIGALRRRLMNMPPPQQVEQLLNAMQRFKTNDDLISAAG